MIFNLFWIVTRRHVPVWKYFSAIRACIQFGCIVLRIFCGGADSNCWRVFSLKSRAVSPALKSIRAQPSGGIFFIDHGMGVVIGETAEIGDNVTLYHGVTLGGTSLNKVKRHPTIEDHVVIGAGAKVLGAITIGTHSRIGANAVVVKSTPPDSVVVGVPGQVVVRDHPAAHFPNEKEDLEHGSLPDTIGQTLVALITHVEALEKRLNGGVIYGPALHAPEHGIWHGEDFTI
jgi:serine O-acetyltransferase